MYRIHPIESVSAHGTHTPIRGTGASWLGTLGSAPALTNESPASLAAFHRASASPSCAGKIHEPAGNSEPPMENFFSAISILNFASTHRAVSKLSCPVSRSRNIGPTPETAPKNVGDSVTGVSAAVRLAASA